MQLLGGHFKDTFDALNHQIRKAECCFLYHCQVILEIEIYN